MDQATLRIIVWDEMIFADMRANYFAELMRHYVKLDKMLRVGTLIASSGAFITALPNWGTEARIVAPLLATAASLWLFVSQYSSMARDSSDLQSGWGLAARDYERLWNSLDSPDAEKTYHQIYDRAEALSKSGGKFPYKKRRLDYWLDQAATMATARYA